MNHNPNPTERAARAEACAAELDSAISLLLNSSPSYGYTPEEKAAHMWRAQCARESWSRHLADYGTLAINTPEPR